MLFKEQQSINQSIKLPFNSDCTVTIKREDLLHPIVSGNKFRKLKYNFEAAKKGNFKQVITFGGAFSNHISATAKAGQIEGVPTIGIIRGDELANKPLNSTLSFAKSCGMQLVFIDRTNYRLKDTESFKTELLNKYPNSFIVPEGGTNDLAIKGCEEILTTEDYQCDYICCAAGTGGTSAGIINKSRNTQQVEIFSALKGNFLVEEISKFANKSNWHLHTNYHFGGYAKVTPELIEFVNDFNKINNIQLDPIYTGKMVFGVYKLIQEGYFKPNSNILLIHTGGLQGITGINNQLKQKGWPLIQQNNF